MSFVLTKNTFALILTALITFGFFFAGIFGILDYFIVKALLFLGFLLLAIYVFLIVSAENKNHLK